MRDLTVALAKGRLAQKAMEMFGAVGIHCEEMANKDSRKLIFGEKVCRVLGVCGIGILFVVKIRRERRRVRET